MHFIRTQVALTLWAHLKTSQLGYLLVPVLSRVVSVDRPTNVSPESAGDRTDRAMLEFLQSKNARKIV